MKSIKRDLEQWTVIELSGRTARKIFRKITENLKDVSANCCQISLWTAEETGKEAEIDRKRKTIYFFKPDTSSVGNGKGEQNTNENTKGAEQESITEKSGLGIGAIVGIAVGATVGLLLIVFAVLFILNKKGVINIAFLNKLMKK